MKKYDLIILGVYIVLTIAALAMSIAYMDPSHRMKKQAVRYVKSMYEQPVRVVSIRQTNLPLTVISDSIASRGKRFRFEGTGVDPEDIYQCKVVNDTLYISGEWRTHMRLVLFVAPDIQVDTVDASRVQLTVNR